MERLTVDNPRNNLEALHNFAYAKDRRVFLSYADGEAGVDLCEYVAKHACCEDIDAAAVMEGACMECDCVMAILYTVAVQAAELRERLKYYEDREEQGQKQEAPVLRVLCGITGTACVDCKDGSCEARRMGVPSDEA